MTNEELIEELQKGYDLLRENYEKENAGLKQELQELNRVKDKERSDDEYTMHLATIVKFSEDAIISKSLEGNIKSWNNGAEKIFGYTAEEAIGKHISLIIPEGYITEEKLILEKIKNSEVIKHYETVRVKKNGEQFFVSLTVSPLKDKEGKIVGVSKIVRDISSRKSAEELLNITMKNLERSNKELGQFAYVASHDLQEPLRMISSYVQLFSNRYKDKLDNDARDFIHYIVDGAVRMQNLINNLLEFSRLNTSKNPMMLCDCNSVMDKVRENIVMWNEDKKIMISSDVLPNVIAFEKQMEQLFQNLISNGIKYNTSALPMVHIAATEGNSEWRFSVTDNGIGIESKYHESIFGMFQRLHSREEYSGTGIGLAICRKIVEIHGGRIWLESEPGKGSVFYFTLPKIIEESKVTFKKDVINKRSFDWHGKTILIAEDFGFNFEILNAIFQETGIDIIHAVNGIDAVDKLQKHPETDVILMDIRMPKMDGIEATQSIRQFNKTIPVIIQSALMDKEDSEKAIAAGCTDYLMKPIDKELMFAMIDSFMTKDQK